MCVMFVVATFPQASKVLVTILDDTNRTYNDKSLCANLSNLGNEMARIVYQIP